MNASKARRKFNKWRRYQLRYPGCGPTNFLYHRGYVTTHWNAMTARRSAPHGIRVVWMVGTVSQRERWVDTIGSSKDRS